MHRIQQSSSKTLYITSNKLKKYCTWVISDQTNTWKQKVQKLNRKDKVFDQRKGVRAWHSKYFEGGGDFAEEKNIGWDCNKITCLTDFMTRLFFTYFLKKIENWWNKSDKHDRLAHFVSIKIHFSLNESLPS